MKTSCFTRSHSPPVVRLVLIVAVMLLTQVTGWADVVQIAGTATGSFDGGGMSLGGLSYANGGFNVWTNTNGDAVIEGSAGNLGTFSLNSTPFLYSGHTFNLVASILAPSGSSGGNTIPLPLLLSVDSNGNGGVHILASFPQWYTFPTEGEGTGFFLLGATGLDLKPGESASLTGYIAGATGVPVPESFDLALVGLGTLVALFGRRKWLAA